MISQMSSQKELLLRGMYVMMNDYKKIKTIKNNPLLFSTKFENFKDFLIFISLIRVN